MARTTNDRKHTNGSSTTLPPPRPVAVAAPPRPVQPTASNDHKPTVDQVRARAFELYQARAKTGRPGDSTMDWLEAERQLRSGSAR